MLILAGALLAPATIRQSVNDTSMSSALDNYFGYLAPHLNETRGELRTRESNVVFQDKKQIRVSLWKDSRRAIDVFQFGLQ